MKKWIPLLILAAAMITLYFLGFFNTLNFKMLQSEHARLQKYVAEQPLWGPLFFIAMYIVATALSIPGGVFLTLLMGFLFEQPYCAIYVVVGATLGATLLFLAAKTALRPYFEKKAAPFLSKMEAGFNKNAVSYMFFLRLVPLFPFWLVNLAPAFFNVPTWTYVWTTFLGIIPGTFVFAQAGRGLSAIFESGEELSIDSILNLQVRIALIALGILALVPVVIKKFRRPQ